MQIEMWPIERLKQYDRNPRNNEAGIGPVAESIHAYGFLMPVVADKNGVVICGHTRIKAARQLGLTEVPVVCAEHLTPEQVQELRVVDNKLHELSSWNPELLRQEMAEILARKVEPELPGYTKDELAELLGTVVRDGFTDPDQVPEPPDEAITKPGDLWILGNHRLLCGDSANTEHVDRLLDGARIEAVNTDPPYNVKVEPRSKAAIAAGNSSFITFGQQASDSSRHSEKTEPAARKLRAKDRPLENDFVSDEEFNRLLHAWFSNIARALEPGRGYLVWAGYSNLDTFGPTLRNCDLVVGQVVVWDKLHPVLTRKDMMGCFELAFYGWKRGAAHQFFGPNNATDLWHVKKVNPQRMVHLTEKPVELAVRSLQYLSRSGENVLDLFGGSGSTLIAAEQTGRNAFLMEIDPPYCDVIVQRFETFTGKKAERKACNEGT